MKMQVHRVLNNNLILVLDQDGQEMILKGKGLGFQMTPGSTVDETKIEQRFVIESSSITRRFEQVLVNVNQDCIEACMDVIAMIQQEMEKKLSDMLYVTLVDHVSNLLERIELGLTFDNTLLWDIKRIYTREYAVAQKAVAMLSKACHVELDPGEANFITLHIVNAEMNTDMRRTMKITGIINDICDIVSSDFNMEFDENDYFYNRFLMHLKFCFENSDYKVGSSLESGSVLMVLQMNYPRAWKTIEKITDFIYGCLNRRLTTEEQLYLMVHLVQITNKSAQ